MIAEAGSVRMLKSLPARGGGSKSGFEARYLPGVEFAALGRALVAQASTGRRPS